MSGDIVPPKSSGAQPPGRDLSIRRKAREEGEEARKTERACCQPITTQHRLIEEAFAQLEPALQRFRGEHPETAAPLEPIKLDERFIERRRAELQHRLNADWRL